MLPGYILCNSSSYLSTGLVLCLVALLPRALGGSIASTLVASSSAVLAKDILPRRPLPRGAAGLEGVWVKQMIHSVLKLFSLTSTLNFHQVIFTNYLWDKSRLWTCSTHLPLALCQVLHQPFCPLLNVDSRHPKTIKTRHWSGSGAESYSF